jgi:general secretion pathway protein A
MLLDFYGFSDKPFELLPDLTFLYLTRSYKMALETILSGINERKGLMVLIGEVGTGKTMLIHGVMEKLPPKVKTAFIFHSTYEFKELLQQILLELGEPAAFEETQELKKPFLVYLREIRGQGELLTVLIDEAHLLSKDIIEDLFRLYQLEPWISETLQIVLVGQPELEQTYVDAFYKYRLPKTPVGIKIKPLSARESMDYIEHRLRMVGKSSDEIFSPQAISLIIEKAEGIPRVINNLCDNALYTGYNASVKIISADIIQKVIGNLEGPDYKPTQKASLIRNVAFRYFYRKWQMYPRPQMP